MSMYPDWITLAGPTVTGTQYTDSLVVSLAEDTLRITLAEDSLSVILAEDTLEVAL